MSHHLGIKREESNGTVTLRVAGDLVAGRRAERLLWAVRGVLRSGARSVTLDLTGVSLIDCCGIGVLVLCRKEAQRCAAALLLTGARGPVGEMLRLSALCDAPLLVTA